MQRQGISRRDFLAGGVAAGALIAASRLHAADESAAPGVAGQPGLFAGRGRFERLSLVCQHIEAGAEKPFSLLHISDTHLTAAYPTESEWTRRQARRRARVFGGCQEQALADSLAWAKEHVDYVLHTGDLIDFQSEANFDLVRKYYGEGGAMMFGALGNHEYYYGQPRDKETDAFKHESRAKLSAAYPFDVDLASTVVNGVNFVTLDNVFGTVSAAQATRFQSEVSKGLPIVLCQHCPFNTPNIWRAATRFWNKASPKALPDASKWSPVCKDAVTKDFVQYLKAQPLLKAILAGHDHISVCDRFSPTAMEYVVGGNFLFLGQEIVFS